MKTNEAFYASTVAGCLPRPVAPTTDPTQGSGVPAGAGLGRLRVTGLATSIEHDSAPGAPTV